MKHAYLLILLLLPLAAAQAGPFVEDGRIVAKTVVGDDAPSTDVIFAAQIAQYLQTYASEATLGVGAVSSTVDIDDGGVYILIGTPEDNPLIDEALAGDPTGPYLSLDGSLMIISGPSEDDVAYASNLFIQGVREAGSLEEARLPEKEVLPQPEETQEEDPVPEQVDDTPEPVVVEEPVAKPTVCTPSKFCNGKTVKKISDDCTETSLEYCPDGCEDAKCTQSGFGKFISGIVDFITFWN